LLAVYAGYERCCLNACFPPRVVAAVLSPPRLVDAIEAPPAAILFWNIYIFFSSLFRHAKRGW
jgi:hypothetical protein